jgi:hypothetical protein
MMLNTHALTGHALCALALLLEGERAAPNDILYSSVIGFDQEKIGQVCRAVDTMGKQAVIALFARHDVMAGVSHVGVTSAMGDDIRLNIGRVWLGADGKRARIVATHDVGGRNHFVLKHGRFVRTAGWPADLEPGYARAAKRLNEITALVACAGVVKTSAG